MTKLTLCYYFIRAGHTFPSHVKFPCCVLKSVEGAGTSSKTAYMYLPKYQVSFLSFVLTIVERTGAQSKNDMYLLTYQVSFLSFVLTIIVEGTGALSKNDMYLPKYQVSFLSFALKSIEGTGAQRKTTYTA